MTEHSDRPSSGNHSTDLASLTQAEEESVKSAIRIAKEAYGYKIELHFCFRNAQSVMMADHNSPAGSQSLQYFEGYVPSPEGVAPHAWIEIHGKVVDITFMCCEAGLRVMSKIRYYGKQEVPINRVREYFQLAREHGEHGSILGLRLTPPDQICFDRPRTKARG